MNKTLFFRGQRFKVIFVMNSLFLQSHDQQYVNLLNKFPIQNIEMFQSKQTKENHQQIINIYEQMLKNNNALTEIDLFRLGYFLTQILSIPIHANSITNEVMAAQLKLIIGYTSYIIIPDKEIYNLEANYRYILLDGLTLEYQKNPPKEIFGEKIQGKSQLKIFRIGFKACKRFEQNLIMAQQNYFIIFLKIRLGLSTYQIKKYQLLKHLTRQNQKKGQKIVIDHNYLYFIENGSVLLISKLNQTQKKIILTQGSIVNQNVLVGGCMQKIILLIEDVTFIKLNVQILYQLLSHNQETEQRIIKMFEFFNQQRNQVKSKNFNKNQIITIQDNFQHFDTEDFLKRQHKTSTIRNSSPASNNINKIQFIYPISQIVKNQTSIYLKNKKQRSMKQSCKITQFKSKKDIQIIKKKYYAQKIQNFKIKKRAQREISNSKTFFKENGCFLELQNTLFNQTVKFQSREMCHKIMMEKKNQKTFNQSNQQQKRKKKQVQIVDRTNNPLYLLKKMNQSIYKERESSIFQQRFYRFTTTEMKINNQNSKFKSPIVIRTVSKGKIKKIKIIR